MKIVFLGLSITSSWGNGHATNYRALVRALRERGHDVTFLERDRPWYAEHRDDPDSAELYGSVDELHGRIGDAGLVVIGSYVPDGVAVAELVLEESRGRVFFYDIDTPVTLAKLRAGDREYLAPQLVPRFDLYLSFAGGPLLHELETRWGARRAVAFHCLVDDRFYRPVQTAQRWLLGYLGTYSPDRQPLLERLLFEPARALPDERFVVAGPGYPDDVRWPENVERIEHLAPPEHPRFYCAQAFTLSVTRADMARAGWSPSVRLFEAGACGVPVITDPWPGVDSLFGDDVFVAGDVCTILRDTGEDERRRTGDRLRRRVLAAHTAAHRAATLERLAA
jgi:spore maturation protein CgeB